MFFNSERTFKLTRLLLQKCDCSKHSSTGLVP
jgi:hypothetical protein